MIEDVYEPLGAYRDRFRARFYELAQEKFRQLVEASGIDIAANRQTVAEIHAEEKRLASTNRWKTFYCFLIALSVFVLAVALACVLAIESPPVLYCVSAGVPALAVLVFAISKYRRLRRISREQEKKIREGIAVAESQLAPLNRLYTWDLIVKLIEKAVPRLQFDPYFTENRLADMRRLYDWSEEFSADKSVHYAQSGVINGNPFVFADYLDMEWGVKEYVGTKTITWVTYEKDSQGRRRPVTHTEVLRATVEAPYPEYSRSKVLIYGNDAAPKLTFSRAPSDLSGDNEGFWARRKMKKEIAKLEEFSRNLDDESNYTIMGNREFEALFQTTDRSDEVEYRLLFTPVAQRQMLDLIKDKDVGYGDDFGFLKDHKINYIYARHLNATSLSTDPARFADWDYDRAAKNFMDVTSAYFKNVYFAFAPLLAVPIYQQLRTHEEIWKDVVKPGSAASYWEYEAFANYLGMERFKHPDCATKSILKSRLLSFDAGVGNVEVTAHGYREEPRVTYKDVRGGDGRWHSVRVDWIEYLPVSRTSVISVASSAPDASIARDMYKGCLSQMA